MKKPKRTKPVAGLDAVLRSIPGYDPFATAAKGEWFDEDAACRALRFFPGALKHIEGKFAGEPFVLRPDQQAIIANLFGWKRADGTRRYRESLIGQTRGSGKALALNTPIPTRDGWTTMGEIDVGDTLFDECGLPCTVLEAHPVQIGNPCYCVTFSDGAAITADAEHLWTVRNKNTDRLYLHTTARMAMDFNAGNRGYVEARYSIPVAGALHCAHADLPVDPYVLGVWLGDGDSDCARLTFALDDAEIWEHLYSVAGVVTGKIRKDGRSNSARATMMLERDGRCRRGHIGQWNNKGRCLQCERETDRARRHGLAIPPHTNTTLDERIGKMGLLGNKHIPAVYLRGSISQRLALLQGLMDTDGGASDGGRCEFCNMSIRLAEGVIELVRSLGLKPTMKIGRATLRGKDCGTKYRVSFTAFSDTPVFRLGRKLRLLPNRIAGRSQTTSRQIIDISPVASVPVRCIRVSSPSNLFLAGRSMIATHNTPLAAGIANYLFFADDEQGCVGFITATTVEQAGLCFRHVHGQIVREPEMRTRCKINVSQKSVISGADRNAVMRVVSADGGALHGGTPHFWIMDEVHAWGAGSKEVWEAIKTSFAKSLRRQPLRIAITTRDFDRPSVCTDLWIRAEKIRDGVISDSSFLPAIWAADDDADWTDEAVWEAANPGIDVTVDRVSLRQMCDEAQLSTATENSFKRLHLNMKTGQDIRWLTLEDWDKCKSNIDEELLIYRPVYAAIDLSAVKDITALALVFPDGENFDLLTYFWLPESRANRADRQGEADYLQWAADGHMYLTPGDVVDYAAVRRKVNELGAKFNFRTIGIDPWGAKSESILRIRDDGFNIMEVGQNYEGMSEPSKHFERLLIGGKVRHNGNPVMRWMISNVSAITDGNENIKPSKKKSTGRIDGVVATVMAVGMMNKGEHGNTIRAEDILFV